MSKQKRTSAEGAAEALVGDHGNDASRVIKQPLKGQLIDRYGHVHSEAVLINWSPQALKALGIHRVGDEPEGGTH
jgi:hypothetical protein